MATKKNQYGGIVISSPGANTPDHPVETPGCLITAYGTATNPPLAKVVASVGQWTVPPSDPSDPSVHEFVEGFVTGCSGGVHWCFEKRGNDDKRVPGARGCGLVDMLVVWYYEADGKISTPENAYFRGIGGCCSGSGSDVCYATGAPPLFAVATRVVTVTLAPGKLSLTEESEILVLGGLLQRSAVTLVYDPLHGGPDEPVWRNADESADGGTWTLQVAAKDGNLNARLTFQRVTPNQVLPPVTWVADGWDFSGNNTMVSTHKLASGKTMPRLNVSP